jgi:hypothetical protein
MPPRRNPRANARLDQLNNEYELEQEAILDQARNMRPMDIARENAPPQIRQGSTVYHKLLIPLSAASRNRLLRYGTARISPASRLTRGVMTAFYLPTREYNKIMKKLDKGKGANVSLNRKLLKVNMQYGKGIWEDLKAQAMPLLKEHGMPLARKAAEKGLEYLSAQARKRLGGGAIRAPGHRGGAISAPGMRGKGFGSFFRSVGRAFKRGGEAVGGAFKKGGEAVGKVAVSTASAIKDNPLAAPMILADLGKKIASDAIDQSIGRIPVVGDVASNLAKTGINTAIDMKTGKAAALLGTVAALTQPQPPPQDQEGSGFRRRKQYGRGSATRVSSRGPSPFGPQPYHKGAGIRAPGY